MCSDHTHHAACKTEGCRDLEMTLFTQSYGTKWNIANYRNMFQLWWQFYSFPKTYFYENQLETLGFLSAPFPTPNPNHFRTFGIHKRHFSDKNSHLFNDKHNNRYFCLKKAVRGEEKRLIRPKLFLQWIETTKRLLALEGLLKDSKEN